MADGPRATTLVNAFECEPHSLNAFLRLWQRRARFLSEQPGFLRLRLLQAESAGARFQVVVISEWESVDALHQATCQGSFHAGARHSVEELGVIAHPGIYRVTLDVESALRPCRDVGASSLRRARR